MSSPNTHFIYILILVLYPWPELWGWLYRAPSSPVQGRGRWGDVHDQGSSGSDWQVDSQLHLTPYMSQEMWSLAFLTQSCLHCQLEKVCCIISPSSLISLIRSSHTNVEDKDENPTLASLTISPSVPHFSGNVQALWSAYLCMWQHPCCAQRSHQLDPVTDVCAVVGIWKGVQQQLVNAVHIPTAPIHQCDKDVSHASRACQDEPWCRIANAFVHPLRRETPCSDSRGNTRPHMLQTSKPHIDRS